MIKPIKFCMVAMLAIMTSVALTACGDDDKKGDEPDVIESAFLGSWAYSYMDADGDAGETETVTFKSNGTYEWERYEFDILPYDDDISSEIFIESGTYTFDDDIITIKCTKLGGDFNEGPVSDYVGQVTKLSYSVVGKTLYIKYDNNYGDISSCRFTKK